MGIILLVLIGLYGLIMLLGLISAIIANSKGYRPWFWILSMGPLGLIILLLTKGLNRATTPEERERWETQTDWTGGVLSGLTFMTVFALPVLGAAAFLSARAVTIPVPPPIAPPQVAVPVMAPPASDELVIEPPAQAGPAEQPQQPAPAADGNPKSP